MGFTIVMCYARGNWVGAGECGKKRKSRGNHAPPRPTPLCRCGGSKVDSTARPRSSHNARCGQRHSVPLQSVRVANKVENCEQKKKSSNQKKKKSICFFFVCSIKRNPRLHARSWPGGGSRPGFRPGSETGRLIFLPRFGSVSESNSGQFFKQTVSSHQRQGPGPATPSSAVINILLDQWRPRQDRLIWCVNPIESGSARGHLVGFFLTFPTNPQTPPLSSHLFFPPGWRPDRRPLAALYTSEQPVPSLRVAVGRQTTPAGSKTS